VPYITNKFDVFISNDIMRPIIAQEKSAFNFRKVMDEKKILLVNLAKGRLGDINSSLLGLVIVGKILMAALSRVDVMGSGTKPADFYLYIDEFQNVTTDSISTILSEARKYRLSLNIAHQFIAQLQDSIKDSVFGNVGSMAVFRVGTEDAEFLQKQFDPIFTQSDIIKLENYNAYMKLLIGGQPGKPFNIKTVAPNKGNREMIPLIKELSYLKYGRDRAQIEAEILAKYKR
jgi:DNA helicase HerA-like ATPase